MCACACVCVCVCMCVCAHLIYIFMYISIAQCDQNNDFMRNVYNGKSRIYDDKDRTLVSCHRTTAKNKE